MRNIMWYNSKQSSVGFAIVLAGVGGVFTYIKPDIGIPFLIVLCLLGVWLIIRAYRNEGIPQKQLTAESIRQDINRKIAIEQGIVLVSYILLTLVFGIVSLTFNRPLVKPKLVLDAQPVTAEINTANHTASIGMDFIFVNVSDSPAYQFRFRAAFAPLLNPSDIIAIPDQFDSNPIINPVRRKMRWNHTLPYNGPGLPDGIILVYTNLQYSDSPVDGHWYSEDIWLGYILHADTQTVEVISQKQEEKDLFKPFVDSYYSTP